VAGHFDWNVPIRLTRSRLRRESRRPSVVAATILGIGGPCIVFAIRGPCWEALLGSIAVSAIALALIRPPFSMWLAAVLVVSMCGSVGLIGWSAWRFRSVNVFSSYSPRLTMCERQYEPEGSAQTQLTAPFKNLTHHVMGVTPSGSAVLGAGCQTTVLFVKSPGPVYQPYDLLGGP
jgi:hypothetical protein